MDVSRVVTELWAATCCFVLLRMVVARPYVCASYGCGHAMLQVSLQMVA